MDFLQELRNNKDIFFRFMREKYYIFYNSNIFFRDIQYAIRSYFEKKGQQISYDQSQTLAKQFTEYLEAENQLTRMDNIAWKVNFHFEDNVEKKDEEVKEEKAEVKQES